MISLPVTDSSGDDGPARQSFYQIIMTSHLCHDITVALVEPRSTWGPANTLDGKNGPEGQLSPPSLRPPFHCYQLGCRHGARLQRGHGEAETASLAPPSLCSFSWRSDTIRGMIWCDKLPSHPKKKAQSPPPLSSSLSCLILRKHATALLPEAVLHGRARPCWLYTAVTALCTIHLVISLFNVSMVIIWKQGS